jgi:stage IV sporulation protein FB
MIRFRWLGIRWQMSAGFFSALFLFLTWNAGGFALEMLLAAAVHEGGHLLAAVLLSVPIEEADFTIQGLHLKGKASSSRKDAAVLVSGPVLGLLWAALAWKLGWNRFSAASAVLSGYHLLPVRGLDGGSLTELLFARYWGEAVGEKASVLLSALFCAVGVIAVLVRSIQKGFSFGAGMLLVLMTYGFCSSAAG